MDVLFDLGIFRVAALLFVAWYAWQETTRFAVHELALTAAVLALAPLLPLRWFYMATDASSPSVVEWLYTAQFVIFIAWYVCVFLIRQLARTRARWPSR